MKIEIDLEKNVESNAQKYFEKAKKSKKKLEGARKAIKETEKKLEKEKQDFEFAEIKKEKQKQEKERKKEWYEKFRWCLSSDDFLIIGGKDATSNEVIIKKYLDPQDLVFHTESPGSPFIIIKNPEKRTIPDKTKREAAIIAATYSRAWNAGVKRMEVFEVKPEQVTKETKSGEYIQKGSFVIQGKKETYDVEINLAIGTFNDDKNYLVVMAGPESAVSKHCKDYIKLRQGNSKKGEISKMIMKKFNLATNDDIIASLPAGEFAIHK
jgi:predicted ribosome quality control (RQC) complex YloA/Tae2 family protein